jgi:hypothetical protein
MKTTISFRADRAALVIDDVVSYDYRGDSNYWIFTDEADATVALVPASEVLHIRMED